LASEVEAKQFNLKYSCSKDLYIRYLETNQEILESKEEWSSLTHLSENVFRKEELDWKMVYLARTEGSQSARIQWKFNFELPVNDIKLKFDIKTYENGCVDICFIDENG
jgi:peptide-N4-(N-acetyl-beta-glucosaminyl)asparagine amidase